jgi:CcmD family protein
MSYLFSAFAIVWIVLFLYLLRLAKQGKEIRRDLMALKRELDKKDKG